MRILVAGGGSGGHVTPVVAVMRELKKSHSSAEIRFWCDKGFYKQTKSIVGSFSSSVRVQSIVAGKLRRYHNLPVWRQLLRPVTIVLPNLRDMILVGVGTIQSIFRMIVWRPDVVFTKGGFVCLPVGIAARLLGVRMVVHDSDAYPGLTNRIISRWATAIATGAPLELYPYPRAISRYVGIPVGEDFRPHTAAERRQAKRDLGFDADRPLVVVTGGGLGAQRLNEAIIEHLDSLLSTTSVLLLSGSAHYDELKALTPASDPRFQIAAFISEGMSRVLGAADIVITRAGATTLLELAALAQPTILVPNRYLTGGHQLKNAAVYAKKNAVVVVDEQQLEQQPMLLAKTVTDLLGDPNKMRQLATAFHGFAKPHAAKDVAAMIIAAARKP